MLSLIEQIKSGRLWDFPGGIHPPENKTQSNQVPPIFAPLPNTLILPTKQHIGKSADLLVSVGQTVLKGQPLTQATSTLMLPIHAPTSGIITAIEPRVTAHPSGLPELSIVIQPDGQDKWCNRLTHSDFKTCSPETLIEVIRQAGISGMGGAGFPTANKIHSGLSRTEILIINAAECEPYITADDVLMQHYADEIIQGIEIVTHILSPKAVIIGIEDNKPNAISALEKAAADKDYLIRVIPTKYPSGGEKQLIKILTNLEVPAGKIPADIGLMVQNVGTMYAIQEAVLHGIPLIQRMVTLTGNTFKQPRNVWVRVGTPIEHLMQAFEYQTDNKLPRVIMGGPMMGFTLPHAQVPVTKTTNCILAPTRKEITPQSQEMACIRCGQCADVCPASLLPQQLYWHAKAEEYEKCETLNLKDCIECGACAYVCPSEIPLVQYYRQAKAEIRTRQIEADAAERARVRFEEKKSRQEREKQERESRFQKAAENRRQSMVQQQGGHDAILAAIERVQSKKAAASEEVKPAVAAAIARAKAKQEAAKQSGSATPDNTEMNRLREERKQLARARKAQSQAQERASTTDLSASDADKTVEKSAPQPVAPPEDPKKAAVAAAIARAKARKAQSQGQEQTESSMKEKE